jgi:hypothetical protein
LYKLKDASTALKRLDDFFASEEIKQAERFPLPTDSDETVIVVSIKLNFDIK